MLAKFTSQCPACKGRIDKGDDIELKSGQAFHPSCRPAESAPGPDAYALADKLGYLSPDDAGDYPWSTMATRRQVRDLLRGLGNGSGESGRSGGHPRMKRDYRKFLASKVAIATHSGLPVELS